MAFDITEKLFPLQDPEVIVKKYMVNSIFKFMTFIMTAIIIIIIVIINIVL